MTLPADVKSGKRAAPVELPSGETRTFLGDADELALTGRFVAAGYRSIGLGPCRGAVRG
jgi:fumarylacetoacetase